MENNLDHNIRELLQKREIQPSESAWERLYSQLKETHQKRKNKWILHMGYAASVLLIASLAFFFQQTESTEVQNTLVKEEVEIPQIDKKINIQTTIKDQERTVLANDNRNQVIEIEKLNAQNKVQNQRSKDNFPKFSSSPSVIAKQRKIKENEFEDPLKNIKELHLEESIQIVSVEKDSMKKTETKGISVDSEALLVSVTSSREELRIFYQKYKVNRAEVLVTIQDELNKSNIKIDPNTILSEVEKDVNEENFQNNFYQFIKKRVSNVATAIANRNN